MAHEIVFQKIFDMFTNIPYQLLTDHSYFNLDMETSLTDLKEWCEDNERTKDMATLKALHAQTLKRYQELKKFEDALVCDCA